jgi:tRNA G18 (ribose-2'-O)-methylase SpoU
LDEDDMNDPTRDSASPPATATAAAETGGTHASSGLEFLLYGLQSPINIGMILRVAETYHAGVAIYDPHGVLDDPDKFNTIKDFSCGAAARRSFRRIGDAAALTRMLAGRRLVSTSIDAGTRALPCHRFGRGDVVALGNEYDGLPDDIIRRADTVLHVPMPFGWTPKPKAMHPIDPARAAPVARDGQPSLNVAMTAAIICYAVFAGGLAGNDAAASASVAVR